MQVIKSNHVFILLKVVVGDQDGVITCFGIKKGEAVVSGNVPFKILF